MRIQKICDKCVRFIDGKCTTPNPYTAVWRREPNSEFLVPAYCIWRKKQLYYIAKIYPIKRSIKICKKCNRFKRCRNHERKNKRYLCQDAPRSNRSHLYMPSPIEFVRMDIPNNCPFYLEHTVSQK
jgi:hypothetical protein